MSFRTVALLLPVFAVPGSVAAAQDPPRHSGPRAEVWAGVQVRTRLGDPAEYLSTWVRRKGIGLGVAWHVTDRVAIVIADPELSVSSGASSGTHVDFSILAGPRLRLGTRGRVTPFVQVLAGLAHGDVVSHGTAERVPAGGSFRLSADVVMARATRFQLSPGVGLDVRFGDRAAWRAVQVDERTIFGGAGDHTLSFFSGMVFRLGGR